MLGRVGCLEIAFALVLAWKYLWGLWNWRTFQNVTQNKNSVSQRSSQKEKRILDIQWSELNFLFCAWMSGGAKR